MSSFDEMDAFEGASLSARAMAARGAPYLDDLNPAQREAVEALDGEFAGVGICGVYGERSTFYPIKDSLALFARWHVSLGLFERGHYFGPRIAKHAHPELMVVDALLGELV